MKVYVYRRVSTDSQTESGAGLSAQEDDCQLWASKQGLTITEVFTDGGVGGATKLEKRPALMNAVTALKKGDVLLVSKRDRLGRDRDVIFMIEAAVKQKNARIISVAGEGTDGEDPRSIMMKAMIDVFAEFEKNIICERIKAAMQAKKSRNERVGHIPFGYRLAEDGVHLEEDEQEQSILYQIQGLMKDGLSTRKLALELNKRKAFNRGGSPWNNVSVHRLMKKLAA